MRPLVILFVLLCSTLGEDDSAAAEVFGIPIQGDVLFVIDASNTMDEPFGMHSRLGVVISEVARAIEKLPQNLRFNVAAFDRGLRWTDSSYRLHPAIEKHKKAIIAVVEDLETGEGANFEIALALPIVFTPRPAQVVLITDSRPDDLDHVDEIEKLVEAGIRVDCIGIELTRREAGFLREISGPSGGKFDYADQPRPASVGSKIVSRAGIE